MAVWSRHAEMISLPAFAWLVGLCQANKQLLLFMDTPFAHLDTKGLLESFDIYIL